MLLLKFDAYPEKWWIFAFFVPFDMHPPVVITSLRGEQAYCPSLGDFNLIDNEPLWHGNQYQLTSYDTIDTNDL